MAHTEFNVYVPEVWPGRVTNFFKEKLVAADLMTDLSGNISDGGDIIHVPIVSDDFSANAINKTTGTLSATNPTNSENTITVDDWVGDKFQLSDFEVSQAQSNFNIRDKYARNIGHALARNFDTQLLSLAVSTSQSVSDSTTTLTATHLESAISIAESNSVDVDELAFIFNPKTYYGTLMGNSKFYDASSFGGGNAPVPTGALDRLYGVPVYTTPQVAKESSFSGTHSAFANVLAHPEHVMYGLGTLPGPGAMENGVRLQEKPSEDLRVTVIGDMIYGADQVRDVNVALYDSTS